MLTQGFDCLQRGAMPDIHTDHWRYRTKSSPSEALMFCLLVALDSDRKQTFVVILRPRMKKKRKKQERYYNSKCTFRITTQSNESHSGLRYLRTGASMVQRQSTWHLWCSAFPVYIYSPTTSLCFVYWPDGATDNSLHHRWTVFSISSSIHVECSASFCPFFHISVTVQKSAQDETICAFIPEILLNLSLRHCDSTFLFRDLEVFGFTSR